MVTPYKIAFNTANLVGRVSNYRFSLKDWGEQHKKTAAQTDAAAWTQICREIAAAGYTAVEVWQAHADPSVMDATRAATWKKTLADHHLAPIGYAGSYTPQSVQICQWLGIPAINGGFWGTPPLAEIERLARTSGVRFNYENHPEKNAREILGKINGGSDMVGANVDTGWLATQKADVVAEVQALGKLVRHIHIKDATTGTHATCPLGSGGASLAGVIAHLKSIGYAGYYSWEDEPEGRNPMDIAAESRLWIENELKK